MTNPLHDLLRPDDSDAAAAAEAPKVRTVRCQSCDARVLVDDEAALRQHQRGRCSVRARLEAAHEEARAEAARASAGLEASTAALAWMKF